MTETYVRKPVALLTEAEKQQIRDFHVRKKGTSALTSLVGDPVPQAGATPYTKPPEWDDPIAPPRAPPSSAMDQAAANAGAPAPPRSFFQGESGALPGPGVPPSERTQTAFGADPNTGPVLPAPGAMLADRDRGDPLMEAVAETGLDYVKAVGGAWPKAQMANVERIAKGMGASMSPAPIGLKARATGLGEGILGAGHAAMGLLPPVAALMSFGGGAADLANQAALESGQTQEQIDAGEVDPNQNPIALAVLKALQLPDTALEEKAHAVTKLGEWLELPPQIIEGLNLASDLALFHLAEHPKFQALPRNMQAEITARLGTRGKARNYGESAQQTPHVGQNILGGEIMPPKGPPGMPPPAAPTMNVPPRAPQPTAPTGRRIGHEAPMQGPPMGALPERGSVTPMPSVEQPMQGPRAPRPVDRVPPQAEAPNGLPEQLPGIRPRAAREGDALPARSSAREPGREARKQENRLRRAERGPLVPEGPLGYEKLPGEQRTRGPDVGSGESAIVPEVPIRSVQGVPDAVFRRAGFEGAEDAVRTYTRDPGDPRFGKLNPAARARVEGASRRSESPDKGDEFGGETGQPARPKTPPDGGTGGVPRETPKRGPFLRAEPADRVNVDRVPSSDRSMNKTRRGLDDIEEVGELDAAGVPRIDAKIERDGAARAGKVLVRVVPDGDGFMVETVRKGKRTNTRDTDTPYTLEEAQEIATMGLRETQFKLDRAERMAAARAKRESADTPRARVEREMAEEDVIANARGDVRDPTTSRAELLESRVREAEYVESLEESIASREKLMDGLPEDHPFAVKQRAKIQELRDEIRDRGEGINQRRVRESAEAPKASPEITRAAKGHPGKTMTPKAQEKAAQELGMTAAELKQSLVDRGYAVENANGSLALDKGKILDRFYKEFPEAEALRDKKMAARAAKREREGPPEPHPTREESEAMSMEALRQEEARDAKRAIKASKIPPEMKEGIDDIIRTSRGRNGAQEVTQKLDDLYGDNFDLVKKAEDTGLVRFEDDGWVVDKQRADQILPKVNKLKERRSRQDAEGEAVKDAEAEFQLDDPVATSGGKGGRVVGAPEYRDTAHGRKLRVEVEIDGKRRWYDVDRVLSNESIDAGGRESFASSKIPERYALEEVRASLADAETPSTRERWVDQFGEQRYREWLAGKRKAVRDAEETHIAAKAAHARENKRLPHRKQPKIEDVPPEPTGTPETIRGERPPGWVGRVKLDELTLRPDKLQHKNADAKGRTGKLDRLKVYESKGTPQITVWKHPTDGKTYVVNGHQRFNAAQRLGETDIKVEYLEAKSFEDAHTQGAEANMREGTVKPEDAAEFLRGQSLKGEELDTYLTDRGIELTTPGMIDGAKLANLAEDVYIKARTGKMPMNKALEIGRLELPEDVQLEIVKQTKLATDEVEPFARRMMEAEEASGKVQNALPGFEDAALSTNLYMAEAKLEKTLVNAIRADVARAKALGKGSDYAELHDLGHIDKKAAMARAAEKGAERDAVTMSLTKATSPLRKAISEGARMIDDAPAEKRADVRRQVSESLSKRAREILEDEGFKFEEPAAPDASEGGLFGSAPKITNKLRKGKGGIGGRGGKGSESGRALIPEMPEAAKKLGEAIRQQIGEEVAGWERKFGEVGKKLGRKVILIESDAAHSQGLAAYSFEQGTKRLSRKDRRKLAERLLRLKEGKIEEKDMRPGERELVEDMREQATRLADEANAAGNRIQDVKGGKEIGRKAMRQRRRDKTEERAASEDLSPYEERVIADWNEAADNLGHYSVKLEGDKLRATSSKYDIVEETRSRGRMMGEVTKRWGKLKKERLKLRREGDKLDPMKDTEKLERLNEQDAALGVRIEQLRDTRRQLGLWQKQAREVMSSRLVRNDFDDFFPRVLQQEILEKLRNGDEATIEELIDANFRKDSSEAERMRARANVMDAVASYRDPPIEGHFGGIELPRRLKVPESWHEPDGVHAWNKYTHRAALQTAEQTHFQYRDPKTRLPRNPDPRTKRGRGDLDELYGGAKRANAEDLRVRLERTLGRHTADFSDSNRLSRMVVDSTGLVQAARLFALNVRTTVIQATQGRTLVVAVGEGPAMAGYKSAIFKFKEARRRAIESGAITPESFREALVGEESASGAAMRRFQKGVDIALTPLAKHDIFHRIAASESAPHYLHKMSKMLNSKSKRLQGEATRSLERFKMDEAEIAEIKSGEVSERLLRRTRQELVEGTQFTSKRSRKLPGQNTPGWGQIMFQLKNFPIKETRFAMNHVIAEARAGNPKPFARYVTATMAMGAVIRPLLEGAMGPIGDAPLWEDVLDSDDPEEALLLLLERFQEDAQLLSFVGLMGDVTSTVLTDDKRAAEWKALNMVTPPVLDQVIDSLVDLGWGVVGGAANLDGERSLKGFYDFIEHTFVVGNQMKKSIESNTLKGFEPLGLDGLNQTIRKDQKKSRGGRLVPRVGKERRVNRLKKRRQELPWR